MKKLNKHQIVDRIHKLTFMYGCQRINGKEGQSAKTMVRINNLLNIVACPAIDHSM